MFGAHRFALAQIEQISAQALTVLSDHKSWPQMRLSDYSASGTYVSSEWLTQFTDAYAAMKGMADQATRGRLKYAISELQTRKTIEAHLAGDSGLAKCRITEIGGLILPYIAK